MTNKPLVHVKDPSTVVDGMGVDNRKREEAERDRNHQNVHHGETPLYV
jgi:hypothetical protein